MSTYSYKEIRNKWGRKDILLSAEYQLISIGRNDGNGKSHLANTTIIIDADKKSSMEVKICGQKYDQKQISA